MQKEENKDPNKDKPWRLNAKKLKTGTKKKGSKSPEKKGVRESMGDLKPWDDNKAAKDEEDAFA